MTWRPPKVESLGHGRRRWDMPVSVLPLSDFHAELKRHSPAQACSPGQERLPSGFWCDACRTIYLRADRRALAEFRLDFLHEMHHAFTDWLGAMHE